MVLTVLVLVVAAVSTQGWDRSCSGSMEMGSVPQWLFGYFCINVFSFCIDSVEDTRTEQKVAVHDKLLYY